MNTNQATFDYSGSHVLVTGGTSGIGAAIAAAYLGAGAEVTITGTRPSAADYAEDLTGYRYLALDIEDPVQVAAVAAAQTKLDILVNSAGVALPSLGLDEYDPEVFARAVNMHLIGVYRTAFGCKHALAASALPGGASVISIASMSSYFGISIVPGYGAGKTGLVGLTRTLAVEWGKHGIRVNAVAAGLTATRMSAAGFEIPEVVSSTLARTPANRLGVPSDIAGAVLFLTSAQAGWITGQTVPVDGGYTIAG